MPLKYCVIVACALLLVRTNCVPGQETGARGEPTPTQAQAENEAAELVIPDVADLLRVDRNTRPSRDAARNSAFVLKTETHAVDGTNYVILTDHTTDDYLQPLRRLAEHRSGQMLQVDDLRALGNDPDAIGLLRDQLRDADVRFLAIAPRAESYGENMLLAMWELISTIDADPQLDAFPGILLASSPEAFAGLIDRSINHVPQSREDVRPFAISQVPSLQELRSLQKAGILRNLFSEHGLPTPTVAVYSAQAAEAPKLPGELFWSFQSERRGDFLTEFPEAAAQEFDRASLLVMHGHGVPGMSCGVDIGVIPESLTAQVVMCGSCFSAAPEKSDFPGMRQAPGGYDVEQRDAFVLRAVDRGASVAFGHMRLSQGFPHLYPVLEAWLQGRTVGEAYQELINGLIEVRGFGPGRFIVAEGAGSPRQPAQNLLLYVIIGDPALQPFEQIIP